ncbi:MAG: SDR family oxidoreductase [Actinomyces sp.]|nr:MAG: SDR family oxidoreductase [Actinomyces sp.]
MGRLEGRRAVITGAGDGIGRGLARVFAAEGARVVVADIDPDAGRRTADELGGAGVFVEVDMGDLDAVDALADAAVAAWGGIDICVNNAWGGGEISRFEHKTPDGLARAMAVGFHGPVRLMTRLYPGMRERGHGRVVNMCSLNGVDAHVGTAEYNAAKEALRAATRTAAREWAPHGVTVNAVCPAAKSAAFRRVMAAHPELEAAADAANPMGRIGDPETDIAPVVVFLAADESRYLTGNTLFVDGGSHINGSAWAPDLGDDRPDGGEG